MKVKYVIGVALATTLATVLASHWTHSQTNKGPALSNSERELLDEINQARANPELYASYLEKLKPLFNGKQYTPAGKDPLTTEEGWNAVDDAIKFLKAAKPLPPLNASYGLSQAASLHVKDQSATGATGHRGANRSMIEERLKPYGSWEGAIGENITYGNDSARERLLTWLIDDGFPSRGHRRRILGNEYQVAGISCGSHPEYSAMCVLTLAGAFRELNSTSAPKPSTTPTKTTVAPSKAAPSKSTKTKSTVSKPKPTPVKSRKF